jgi:hypothetical protein
MLPDTKTATVDVATTFMKTFIFTMTLWPLLSDDKYSTVEQACQLAIKAQDCYRVLGDTLVGTPSVCQLPGGTFLKINLQTEEAARLEFCLMLLYHTYGH